MQEREARKLDAEALLNLEMEMEAKHDELKSYSSVMDINDQSKMELEKEFEEFKLSHEEHVTQIHLEKEAREAELQAKLQSIEMKTKEQGAALQAEKDVILSQKKCILWMCII